MGAFKKYDGSVWQPITPKQLKGVPYTGTLPAVLAGTKAGYLHKYKIYGNLSQNGTPTPENPIYPSECGERTENLFDYRREFDGGVTETRYFRYYLLQLQPNTSYSIYSNAPTRPSTNETSFIITADEDPFNTATGGIWENQAFTMTTKASGLVKVGLRKLKGGASSTIPVLTENDFATGTYWLNLVKGLTVPSTYVPFGYKLPLLSGSTPVDIYIGDDTLSTEEYVDSGTGKIYRMVSGVLTPTDPPVPFPQIPTAAGSTTISWGGSGLAPSQFDSIQEWVDIPTYKRVNGEWVADN